MQLYFFERNLERVVLKSKRKEGKIMLSDVEHEEKKQQILHDCFELFVQQGLENTSMNDLTNYCKTYKAAVYNYFKSKDEIVYEAAKMYMTELREKIQKDMTHQCESLSDRLKRGFLLLTSEKQQLRFVYQVISSPKYGQRSREELYAVYMEYLNYSEYFAECYNISHELFRPYYLLYVATIHDFCLWENEELVNEKLECIYDKVIQFEKNGTNK